MGFEYCGWIHQGHGGTQATEGDYGFDTLIGDLLGLWDALGIEKPHLVGLGLGGATALGLAIDHADRVGRLVPCCCRAEITPEFAALWPGFIATVKAHGMEGMVERTVERWFTDDFKAANPDLLDAVRAQIRGTDPRGYFGCIEAVLTLDFRRRLGDIKAPTLFVSGADDHLGGPPDIMRGLAEAVPGAGHTSVPDAAHICNIQNPAGFNQVLSGFLRAP